MLEAMASGLPVIVTPNVGADAVRDGVEGFVVPIRSPEAVACRLENWRAMTHYESPWARPHEQPRSGAIGTIFTTQFDLSF